MNKKALFTIFLIVFVDVLAFTIVLPFLPFYAEKFGASPFQVGLMVTVFAVCQFLSGPTLGRLSDLYGRRLLLAISQIGTCIGLIVLAQASTLWMIYFARVLDGITAGNITVAQAAMTDVTPPEKRGQAFGLIGIAFGLGFFIGPALSGALHDYGVSAPIWLAVGLSALSTLGTIFFLPKSNPVANAPRFKIKDLFAIFDFALIKKYLVHRETRSPLLQNFFFNMSFTSIIAGFAMFAERRFSVDGVAFGPKEVGFLYAYLGLIGIFSQGFLIGRMIGKFGERTTAMIGFAIQGIGYSIYALAFQIPLMIVAATLGSFGSGMVRPSVAALISRSGGRDEQGAILGVGQSLASMAGILAPLISGHLIDIGSLEAWALFAAGSAFMGLLI